MYTTDVLHNTRKHLHDNRLLEIIALQWQQIIQVRVKEYELVAAINQHDSDDKWQKQESQAT